MKVGALCVKTEGVHFDTPSTFYIKSLLWEYFNPVIIRVINEIKPHGSVLKTYTIHFFVIGPDCIVITGYTKT